MMPKRFIHYSLFFLGIAAVLTACLDKPDFSFTPEISNASVVSYPTTEGFSGARADSLVISFKYRDGDGDLGISAEERSDTVLLNTRYRDWGNYELRAFRYDKGQFIEVDFPTNRKLFFPRLYKSEKAGPIEGTLNFSQNFTYFRGYRMTPLKFSIRIRDRALRTSNVIESDTISLPLLF